MVPHAVLALYILAFSLGVGVISLGALSFQRLRVDFYASFTLFFTASTILILREGISAYDKVTGGALEPALATVLLCLSILGNGLLAYSIPVFSLQLISIPVTRRRAAVHAMLVIALALSGCFKELLPGRLTDILDSLALTGLYAYGAVMLFLGLSRIEDAHLWALVRRFLILVAVLFPLALAQLVLKHLPGSPAPLHEYPFVQIAFYLSSIGLIVAHALRPPAEAIGSPGCSMPAPFVQRYSISPRECEIITMMERGYSNSKLADALFISTRTVKNHVYHVYQKTGVRNKVQLINLIRSFGQ